MDRKKNRSDKYQHVLVESPCSPEMLTEMADSEGYGSSLNPYAYDEEELELKDRLKAAFWRLVDTKLTNRQREVINYYCDGYTQTEIAKILNVNQSSITKSINGNCDYKNNKRVYGGAKKKLQKVAEFDSDVIEILKELKEIQSNR
jgi:DNA-binding CsgD family transcriptional regulator